MSSLAHFIFHTPLRRSGAKWGTWWFDNCPGQNKNNYLITLIFSRINTALIYSHSHFIIVSFHQKPVVASRHFISSFHSRLTTHYQPAMQVRIIPALQDNYMYLLVCDKTKEAAIVDPVEPEKVLKILLTTLWTIIINPSASGGVIAVFWCTLQNCFH